MAAAVRGETLGLGLAQRIQSALAAGGASARVRDVLDSGTAFRVWDHLMLTSSQRENHGETAACAEAMKHSTAARRNALYASLGYMRKANALARLHQRTDALRAHRLAERKDWIRFYGPAAFDALSSYMWTAMGDHDRAEFCLHRTLAVIPEELVRDRALYTAHLALTQARQGELESASATGAKAYALLPSGSKRMSNTLSMTREVLCASGSKAPEVTEWIEVSDRWS